METEKTIKSWKDLVGGSWWVVVGLALVVLAVYGNSLQNEFVSDDITAIVTNPVIGDVWRNIIKSASLTGLIKSAIYLISGTNPILYHLNNIFWHFGVCLLIFFLVRLLTRSRELAAMVAFLFALHPIHTEAVTWVSGYPYLVFSFFILLTLLVYAAIDKGLLGRRWLMAAYLVSFLAYFSSEKAIVLPAIIFAYDLAYSGFKKAAVRVIPFCLTAGVFLWVSLTRVEVAIAERVTTTSPRFDPLIQMPLAIVTYLKLLVWPIPLTLYHEFFQLTTLQAVLNGIVLLTVLVLTLIFWMRKEKFLFFCASLFFIGLAPTLLPFNISWVVAERYVYLSSLGFIGILSASLFWVKRRNESVFWFLLIGLLLLYFGRTVVRNADWKNQDTLWPATEVVSPYSSIAHNNMGDYYSRHGDLQMAGQEFIEAIQLRPGYSDAIHNLGNTYQQMGQATAAAQLFAKALELNPKQLESAINLATVEIELRNYQEAFQALVKAQEISPNSAAVYNSWAVYYFSQGEKQKSVEMLQKALSIDPTYQPAQNNLQILEGLK